MRAHRLPQVSSYCPGSPGVFLPVSFYRYSTVPVISRTVPVISRKNGELCCARRKAPSSALAGHLVRGDASASSRFRISLPRLRHHWCPCENRPVQMPPGRRGWLLPAELIMLPLGRPSGDRHAASSVRRASPPRGHCWRWWLHWLPAPCSACTALRLVRDGL